MSKQKIRTLERRLKERNEAWEDDSEVWIVEICDLDGAVVDRVIPHPTTRLGKQRLAEYLAQLAQNGAAGFSADEMEV